jgi:hypothetical protein
MPSTSWVLLSQQYTRCTRERGPVPRCASPSLFPINAMAIIVALIAAITNGIPLIMWLYVLLAVLYLPAVAFAWVQRRVGLVRELDKGGLHQQTLMQHARAKANGCTRDSALARLLRPYITYP